MELALQIPQDLKRYPHDPRDPLQAWDAADELLLEHFAQECAPLLASGSRILILNDTCGALSLALTQALTGRAQVHSYSDSYIAMRAAEQNGLSLHHHTSDLAAIQGPFDLALLKLPKNLSFLEDELAHLSGLLKPGAPLVCGVMVKHQSTGAFDLLNRFIGPTSTSLAKKKARLIFAALEKAPASSPHPREVRLDGFEKPYLHHSNLFSRERLDIGTRFLLEHLPQGGFESVLDLGCGNGILGISARLANPGVKVIFSDESAMAIASARANWLRFFPQDGQDAEFHWTHAFESGQPASVDLVLCNPPFHQGTAVGDSISRKIFQDARRALRPGGSIRVIGNSHLHYPAILERIFGNSAVVAKNSKFTIVDAIRE